MERRDKLHQVLESLHIYYNKIYTEIVKKQKQNPQWNSTGNSQK